jgi:hypothetical protein
MPVNNLETQTVLISNLKKIINDQNKTIKKQELKIEKLSNERFLFFKFEPRENQKPFIECGESQKYKIQKELSDSIDKINSTNVSLKRYKLKVKSVNFVHEEIFDRVDYKIQLKKDEEREKLGIDHYLYVKDRFNISDRVWTALKVYLLLDIVSAYALAQRRKELNSQFPITETDTGFYCDPVDRMQQQLRHIFKKSPQVFQDKVIVKIQLDGFVIHRLNNLLNFSFSIVNEGKHSTTAFGTYLIGLFRIKKECYDEIKPIVVEIWDKIVTLKSVELGGIQYEVEFKSCSDHKMQAMVII